MPDNLMYTKQRYPGVAQLVARQLWELEAQSSNLCTRTSGKCYVKRTFSAFLMLFIRKMFEIEIAQFAVRFPDLVRF